MSQKPIALQLYTVRKEADADLAGTLRQVAAMGYGAVQFPNIRTLDVTAIKPLLHELGLQVAGCHVYLQDLEQNLAQVIEDAKALDCGYIVCPKWPIWRGRYRAADWQTAAQVFNEIGAACAAQGLQFCYHNHAWEFRRYGDKTALTILLEHTDPHLVQIELDVYWAQLAGHDPATLMRSLAQRVPLLHLKDMKRGMFRKTFTEIGSGILDIAEIMQVAADVGTAWLIVEQDRSMLPSMESARLSLAYLRSLRLLA